jgi:hypothetical protein
VLSSLAAVVLNIAATDHEQRRLVIPTLSVQSGKLGRKLVARTAVRIAEDQQYLPSLIVFQGNLTAVQIGKHK